MVINPRAHAFSILQPQFIPGRGLYILATNLFPVDVGFPAQDACIFLGDVAGFEEGADVEADAVVEVGGPADGLFGQGLPAYENVVGLFAFEDGFQLFLQGFGCCEAFLCSVFTVGQASLLGTDPVAQVGVDQAFQAGLVELVVVNQYAEAVFEAVADVPDKGPVLEQLAVLLEELVAQPQAEGFAADGIEQAVFQRGGPGVAVGGLQQGLQALVGGLFTAHWRQADNAVVIDKTGQLSAALDPFTLFGGQFHLRVQLSWPAVTEQAGDGDLQHAVIDAQFAMGGPFTVFVPDYRATRVAVEGPLGRVIGVGLG